MAACDQNESNTAFEDLFLVSEACDLVNEAYSAFG